MKKYYVIPGLVLAIGFLITAFILINKSSSESKQFREEKSKIAEILNFKDRLLSFRDWVFTEKAWQERKERFDHTMAQADSHLVSAKQYGEYLLYLCLGFFLVVVAIYARRRLFFGLTFSLTFVAMALLGEGVMNPIMEMSAYQEDLTLKFYVKTSEIPYFEEAVDYMSDVAEFMGDVNAKIEYIRLVPYIGDDTADAIQPIIIDGQAYLIEGQKYLTDNAENQVGIDKVFEGKTYYYYQNKGIMEVIKMLWNTDNKPVATAIGAFSVIVPTIKLLFTLFILLLGITKAKRLRKILSYISKWSMADVFVIGAFLAYLSFSNMSPGVTMDARVLFGLYYFGAYVILSIGLGFLLDASINERIKINKKEQKEISE
jgi:hypothetical protein